MAIDVLGKKRLYFDGAMATVLQSKGLELGEISESYNFTHPEMIEAVHKEYLRAGANFITTNTFGANRYKLSDTEYTVEGVIEKALCIAQKARKGFPESFIALDIGATGKVLEPIGDTSFDELYDIFKEQVVAGEKYGADILLFETFTDLYELKVAVLAAKENSKLPIFCTMSFEDNGRTFFGTSIESMVCTLEALGVSALGVNCSLGPEGLKNVVYKMMQISSIPIIVQPNAGLPIMKEGKLFYDITPMQFARCMAEFAEMGVSILGGCCGTSSEYIREMVKYSKDIIYKLPSSKEWMGVCSSSQTVYFDDIVIIGERLNPIGKKALEEAIRTQNMDYIVKEAMSEENEGASLLDVNIGLPDIDEAQMLKKVVMQLQRVIKSPLQLDSANVKALEEATRIYNGKPIINSVNGKKESLEAVLPIAKKYGACILGLTLDENGIPKTAEERLTVAKKIVRAAEEIGIPKKDILIDCLVVTASAQQDLIVETLKAVKLVKEELEVKTVLGISNVSFGLPNRSLMNKTMLTMALTLGLDAAIMNPADEQMMDAIRSYKVLTGRDEHCKDYIEFYKKNIGAPKEQSFKNNLHQISLGESIVLGLKQAAQAETTVLMEKLEPLKIIEEEIIPALNEVGKLYEEKEIFLPELMKAAEAAEAAFEVLKKKLENKNRDSVQQKEKIILATVYGDIHDIGKNIVKVIMQNYGFEIIDLGKNVKSSEIIRVVKNQKVKIVGLSALMTTTVGSMKETIADLKKACPEVKTIVGGAVLSKEIADFVKADYYAKDAMETVRIVQSLNV